MEVLLLLIALTAITGVLVVPAMRRRREARSAMTPGAGPGALYNFVPPEQLDVRLPGPDQDLVEALEQVQREQDWRPAARLLALTDDWELRWQRVQSLAGAAAMELARSRPGYGAEPGRNKNTDKGRDKDGDKDKGNDRAEGTGGGWADTPGSESGSGSGSESRSGSGISFTKPSRSTGGAGFGDPGRTPPRDARWLRDWRAQQPDDKGGAQVYAQFLVWQALADPRSAEYRIILDEARNMCREAERLAPQDPTPFITELFIARGMGYRQPDFESLWSSLRQRAPQHMGAHLAALPYWSEKGHGSRDDAYGFAQSAARSATEGSLLPALPLFAVYDHLPETNMVRGLYQSAVVEHAIEGAQYAVYHAPADHPVLPHVRHLLLCFLVRAERYAEAMEEVRAVDGYVGALPWVDGADPRAEYTAYRALAVAGYEGQGGNRVSRTPPPSY